MVILKADSADLISHALGQWSSERSDGRVRHLDNLHYLNSCHANGERTNHKGDDATQARLIRLLTFVGQGYGVPEIV